MKKENKYNHITIDFIKRKMKSVPSFKRVAESCNTCAYLAYIDDRVECRFHGVVFDTDCDDEKHEYISFHLSEFVCEDYGR